MALAFEVINSATQFFDTVYTSPNEDGQTFVPFDPTVYTANGDGTFTQPGPDLTRGFIDEGSYFRFRSGGGGLYDWVGPAWVANTIGPYAIFWRYAAHPGGGFYFVEDVRTYDDSFQIPIQVDLDLIGGDSPNLYEYSVALGLDPIAVLKALQYYQGNIGNGSVFWISGSVYNMLQAASFYDPTIAAQIGSFLQQNAAAIAAGGKRVADSWDAEHPAMSMHLGDYMSIAIGLLSVAAPAILEGLLSAASPLADALANPDLIDATLISDAGGDLSGLGDIATSGGVAGGDAGFEVFDPIDIPPSIDQAIVDGDLVDTATGETVGSVEDQIAMSGYDYGYQPLTDEQLSAMADTPVSDPASSELADTVQPGDITTTPTNENITINVNNSTSYSYTNSDGATVNVDSSGNVTIGDATKSTFDNLVDTAKQIYKSPIMQTLKEINGAISLVKSLSNAFTAYTRSKTQSQLAAQRAAALARLPIGTTGLPLTGGLFGGNSGILIIGLVAVFVMMNKDRH